MWNKIYDEISGLVEDAGPFGLLFRGHRDANWKLIPGIGRANVSRSKERSIYFDYQTMAGPLIAEDITPWSLAISMQHHGIPTRLLDWTDSFAVALYFALREEGKEVPCVWMLNPYHLNRELSNDPILYTMKDMEGDYQTIFIDNTETLSGAVVAAAPGRHHPRAFSQKSHFTIHMDTKTSLEELAPIAIRKFLIPKRAIAGARKFLLLAGINEYSLFPDLDGLAREIRRLHF
ncbi:MULTISPECIES: FRG domain-containing protein [unclassified Pseudomonas]|uniref:FRG domain-containing protein n=1 Tax=unclassified Pseudomonas TaxID=196821 RepID=UPI000FA1718F|nr:MULTISPECIES: FRG domain-containing protein [unclassified Pseudomonas]